MIPKSAYWLSDEITREWKHVIPKSMSSGLTRGWTEFSDQITRAWKRA